MHQLKCSEIWGGIRGADVDVVSGGVEANLFSSACDSGKGGDIYYFSVCGSDLLTRVAIADVMGHGQAAADTSQWLYDALLARVNSLDGNQVLADLNALAVNHGYKAITTAAIASFYRDTSDLLFSYAGHHPALIRRSGGGDWSSADLPETDRVANLPLGVDDQLSYDQATIPLRSGDLIFLYTDGVIEAKNAAGHLFGLERLLATLGAAGAGIKDVKEAVLAALKSFAGETFAHDDVTFMALKIL